MSVSLLQQAAGEAGQRASLPMEVAAIDCGETQREAHELAATRFAAGRLAALFGAQHVAAVYGLPAAGRYWIPVSTLSRRTAAALGIADITQLWGGIVPAPFMATKLVSHSRRSRHAAAPAGWIDIMGLEDCTLPGWSAFGRGDILAAGIDLLRGGPVRLKCPYERGGHGQHVVHGEDVLADWIGSMPAQVLDAGVVLERDLVDSVTYSVGFSVLPGEHRIAYVGTQRNVATPTGELVYGGSRLELVRGGLAELEDALTDSRARAAVRAAIRYDAVIRHTYGVIASRCNYDVIAGVDRMGRRHLGVLEQSWRFGGASMAELLAIERFAAQPALQRVVAETVETYTGEPAPAGAFVYWRGGAGAPCKYARIVEDVPAIG